jgi:hypothetical protein
MASLPSLADSTSYPALFKWKLIISMISGSSSAMSILIGLVSIMYVAKIPFNQHRKREV